MISTSQVVKVLRTHLEAGMKHIPTGISISANDVPSYKCNKYGLPPICKNSREYHETRSICASFYKSLCIGEQEVTCPFGINISYSKVDNAPMPISFFLQTGFTPETAEDNTIRKLNRVPKKAIKKALEATRLFKFASDHENATLDLLRRTLETLLAGRVAASMRILTHQILTPVQGAMSDLQVIKRKHKEDGYAGDEKHLTFLESNIEEINSVAKQIHILLSEDIEPSQQRIRRITVHRVIKNRCHRLESIATRKDLRFHNKRNNGIQDVDAVPDQIDIVFRCLLDNAAKYSFAGKTDRKRTIDINYNDTVIKNERYLKVFIQNYGCKITEAEKRERRIFELGYRGEFSGDRGRQGTGSGLYIADRIVKAHYGKIEVESKEVESKFDSVLPDDTPVAINTFTVFWPKTFSE